MKRRGDRRGLPDTATGMAEGLSVLIRAVYWLAGLALALALISLVLVAIIAVKVL